MVDVTYLAIGVASTALVVASFFAAKYATLMDNIRQDHDMFKELLEFYKETTPKLHSQLTEFATRLDLVEASVRSKRSLVKQHEPKQTGIDRVTEQTEIAILRLLQEGPRTVPEIRKNIDKSREHTARVMKSLFERGLVSRDESQKPFTYSLTEKGRSLLAGT